MGSLLSNSSSSTLASSKQKRGSIYTDWDDWFWCKALISTTWECISRIKDSRSWTSEVGSKSGNFLSSICFSDPILPDLSDITVFDIDFFWLVKAVSFLCDWLNFKLSSDLEPLLVALPNNQENTPREGLALCSWNFFYTIPEIKKDIRFLLITIAYSLFWNEMIPLVHAFNSIFYVIDNTSTFFASNCFVTFDSSPSALPLSLAWLLVVDDSGAAGDGALPTEGEAVDRLSRFTCSYENATNNKMITFTTDCLYITRSNSMIAIIYK